MSQFSVFWKHPVHGEGSYVTEGPSAQAVGDAALDALASDLCDSEPGEDEEGDDGGHFLDVETIKDDLEIAVYDGSHTARPAAGPAHEVA